MPPENLLTGGALALVAGAPSHVVKDSHFSLTKWLSEMGFRDTIRGNH